MASYSDMVNRGVLPPGGNASGTHVLYSTDIKGEVDPRRCDSYELQWHNGTYVTYAEIDGVLWVLQYPDSSWSSQS